MRSKLILLLVLFTSLVNAQTLFNYVSANGLGSNGDDNLRGSTIDAAGNVYITGRVDGAIDFDPGPGLATYTVSNSCYIAKYNSSGGFVWADVFTGGFSGGLAIGLDATSNVYVTGKLFGGTVDFDPSAGIATLTAMQSDMFFAKYNSSGAYIWAKQVGGLSTVVNGNDMCVTPSGSIIITGDFNMNCDFDPNAGVTTLTTAGTQEAFLAKYDPNGNLVWANGFGDSGADAGYGVDVDASNNIVVTGMFEYAPDFDPGVGVMTFTSAGSTDMFLAKYDATGAYQWAGAIGGVSSEFGGRVKFDNNGDVVISGSAASPSIDVDLSVGTNTIAKIGMQGPDDMFLGHYYGTNGNLIWAKNSASDFGEFSIKGLTVDALNNIYITGNFGFIADFDIGAGTSTIQATNTSYDDIYLAKYDNLNANLIFAKNFGGVGPTGAAGCFVLLNGSNIFLTGEYPYAADMDPGLGTATLNPIGGMDFFIAKYAQCILPQLSGISSPGTVCSGATITLSVISGTLNDATNWNWYTGSCGGMALSTGITITTTAVSNNTFYVKGEGGCVPGGGSCLNMTVTVLPSTNISGLVTTPSTIAPVPVSGSVTLYRFENQFTKFDSITTLPLDVNGNFTATSAPSMSYILKAIPSATNLLITYAPSANGWKSATPFFHGCVGLTSQNISVIPLTNFGTGPGVLTGKVVQGLKYGQRSAQVTAPGNPIKGLTIKGGRNPGGNVGAQDRTAADGTYTLSGLPYNTGGESYFVLVDIPGLDTANTYHKVIVTGSEIFTTLDFVVDSAKVVPQVFVGVKENKMQNVSYKIYPNPTTGKLFILFSQNEPGKISISLTDIAGKIVNEVLPEVFESSKEVTIVSDQSSLEAGIYFLKIRSQNKESVTKIIINK